MRNRIWEVLAVVGLVVTLVAVHVIAQERRGSASEGSNSPGDGPAYSIAMRLYQQSEKADTQRVLACPTIRVLPEQEFRFNSGGSIESTHFESLEFGTVVSGKIGRALEDGEGVAGVPARLRISFGTPVKDSPVQQLVRSVLVELEDELPLGEPRTLELGDGYYCEIDLEQLPPANSTE